MEKIRQFLSVYLNSTNAFIVVAGTLLLLLLIYILVSCFGTGTLRKLNKALLNNSGEDAIKAIDGMRLSGRYKKMWDDYYDAYCHEDTVSLSSYLIKNDMLEGRNLFRIASRVVALGGFSATLIGVMRIPGLMEAEKGNLFGMFFAVLTAQAICEFFYTIFEDAKRKRVIRALEKFEMLSLRKLSGKAASFELKHVIKKLDGVNARIDSMRSGITQLNARLDRQYRFLESIKEQGEEAEVLEEKTELEEKAGDTVEKDGAEKAQVTEKTENTDSEKTENTEE